MSLAKTLTKSSTIRVLESLTGIAIGFLMLPFMITHLGEDMYGLWVVVTGITSAFYIFDLGFGSSITVLVARSIAQKDHTTTNRIISTAFAVYWILALVILIVSILTAFLAPHISKTTNTIDLARTLILITGASLAIEFPFKAFAGIATAHLRFDLVSGSRLSFKLANAAATVLLVQSGEGLIAIAWTNLILNIASNIVFFLIARQCHQDMRVSAKLITKETFKSLFHFSAGTFLIDLTNLIKSRGDIFVIAALLSTRELTIYYVAVRLVDYALEILYAATAMGGPLFARYHTEGNLPQMREKLTLMSRINLMLAGLTLVGFTSLGLPFIKIWMGESFSAETAWKCLLWLLAGKLTFFVFSPSSHCTYVRGDHKFLVAIGIIEALISVATTYALLRFTNLGLIGAAIGMSISFYFTRGYTVAVRLLRQIEMPPASFFYPLAPILVYTTLMLSMIKLIPSLWISPNNYLQVTLSGLLIALIFACGALTILRRDEKDILIKLLPYRLRSHFSR